MTLGYLKRMDSDFFDFNVEYKMERGSKLTEQVKRDIRYIGELTDNINKPDSDHSRYVFHGLGIN